MENERFRRGIGQTLAQIREVIECETDYDNLRKLLAVSESLTSMMEATQTDEPQASASTCPGTNTSSIDQPKVGTPGTAAQVRPTVATGELDLDSLIGSTPAEQQAARDAEIILEVGEMVRSVRDARGVSQEELAELTGMTRSQISDVERGIGRVGPSLITLRRLMCALDDDLVVEPRSRSRPR